MTEKKAEAKRRSWNRKISTRGGPVSFLNIYDGQAEIRIPETVPMGDEGVYVYSHIEDIYRWTATS